MKNIKRTFLTIAITLVGTFGAGTAQASEGAVLTRMQSEFMSNNFAWNLATTAPELADHHFADIDQDTRQERLSLAAKRRQNSLRIQAVRDDFNHLFPNASSQQLSLVHQLLNYWESELHNAKTVVEAKRVSGQTSIVWEEALANYVTTRTFIGGFGPDHRELRRRLDYPIDEGLYTESIELIDAPTTVFLFDFVGAPIMGPLRLKRIKNAKKKKASRKLLAEGVLSKLFVWQR